MSSPEIDPSEVTHPGRPADNNIGTRNWYFERGKKFEGARLAWLRERDPGLETSFGEFRRSLDKILADIKGNTPLRHYTDHSSMHSQVDMGILSCLLEHPDLVSQRLTEQELWGLLLGAYLHDHRMVTGDRVGHEKISEEALNEIPGLPRLLEGTGITVPAIQRICELHSSKTKFDKPDIDPLRTSLLGALLRMADSLDYTADRLPSDQFLVGKSISRVGIFEYHKQECVRRIVIDGASIDVFAWLAFNNIHLIEAYFAKDYPREFLAGLGIAFSYRFLAAESPPRDLRQYECSDDAKVLDLTSAGELARVTEDSAYLEVPATGIGAGLADWPEFRAQMAVPELFSIEPGAFCANTLWRPGLHVITGPPGGGKSVFLLLAIEALLQERESAPMTVRFLPRQRLCDALQGIIDGASNSGKQGDSEPSLLVIDGINVDGDVDHLRKTYGKLWEALDRGEPGLSAVITLADDEWRVLSGVRAGAFVQSLGCANSKGLRQLLGRALKVRGLRLDGVPDAELEVLGTSGESSSPVLEAFADRVIAAAEGSPSYVTALLDDLPAGEERLANWSSHDLPAGVVALRKGVLERSLASGQLPLLATVLLLEKAVDGLSGDLLDRLAASLGAGSNPSIEATWRFRACHCEERSPDGQRLSRGWKLAVQSWRQSGSAASRDLQKKADAAAAKYIDSLCADLGALDSEFKLQFFDDLISLRRHAQAFDVLRDPKLIPTRERGKFERHLREAWQNEYSHFFYGLALDPIEQPLLVQCLEALMCDDPRPALRQAVAHDPELSGHPLSLLYRAECGRLEAPFTGPRLGTADREAVELLYRGALRAAKELGFPAEFQLAVKVLHGLFLYDACGDRDAGNRLWSDAEMATRGEADSRVRGLVLHHLGRSAFHAGRWLDADRYYSEAWDCLYAEGNFVLLSRLGTSMADAWAFLYDLPLAEERIRFCLDVKQLMGDRRGRAASLGVSANIEARKGDYAAAIQHLSEDLRILESVGAPGTSAHIRIKMAEAYLKAGDPAEAERLLMRVERDLGGPDAPPADLGFCWKGLSKVRLAQGNPADAAWRVERLLDASPGPYLEAFLLRLAARLLAVGHWPRSEDTVEDLLEKSQSLFAREELLSEMAVCELYRPLLSADAARVRASCRKASALLSKQVQDVPGAAATLGPLVERLDGIARLEVKSVREVEGPLREIITFLEY